MHYHQIPRQNSSINHGLSPHPQGKILSISSASIKGQIIFNILLCQNGASCCHISYNGHPIFWRRWVPQCNCPAFASPLLNDTCLLQMLKVEMHGGRRAQPHGFTNFPNGGRIPLIPYAGDDIVIYFLLHTCQSSHTGPPVPAIGRCFFQYNTLAGELQTFVPDSAGSFLKRIAFFKSFS